MKIIIDLLNRIHYTKLMLVFFSFLCALTACKQLVEVPEPRQGISGNVVFARDATAIAVVTQVYNNMWGQGGNFSGFCSFTGLSGDELVMYDFSSYYMEWIMHYRNALTPKDANGYTLELWNNAYSAIWVANSAIERIADAASLTAAVKKQLLGEAQFIRAYHLFYLVSLFGDVPLPLTTNYKLNARLPRSPKELVYKQIVKDLKEAQDLLSADYLDGTLLSTTTDRVRPTKWAATALLSRTYLYAGDWPNAEIQASLVIANTAMYDVANTSLSDVFKKNSKETIWALPAIYAWAQNTSEGNLYVLSAKQSSRWTMYLSPDLVNDFEMGDQRKVEWVGSVDLSGVPYNFPYKYKEGANSFPEKEYSIHLRTAEQYLIRAEARARQGKITGNNSAATDLNVIRLRAGLGATTAQTDAAMLDAVFNERRFELFTEGHRWVDMRRFEKIDQIMPIVMPGKGGTWAPYKALAPIAQSEIDKNPALEGQQNPGYSK